MWTRLETVSVLAASLGVTLAAANLSSDSSPRPSSTPEYIEVSFAEDILPIFEASCIQCHGGTDDDGNEVIEAGLYLTSYEKVMQGSEFGSVVDPGDLESMLYVMVSEGDMPEDGDPLTPEQIKLIGDWISEGAKNN